MQKSSESYGSSILLGGMVAVRVVKERPRQTLERALRLRLICAPLLISEFLDDLVCITLCFNYLKTLRCIPHFDNVDAKHCHKRVKYRVKLLKQLRIHFRSEYLSQLHEKHPQNSLSPDLKLDELVLIGEDLQKLFKLSLAKVIELIPGNGKIKTVYTAFCEYPFKYCFHYN
ncbi:hypothetical protein TNCT_25901 [Trichonephila clavata]|uniref:DUF5641 domain-containing protein n=1 Tax=Trichonephila clavata TaxID=2740835 RepID=A0A8X6HNX2_TRICU|nr:hypothetical protein TNCT_25901 [Trichonephila clavata]